MSASERREEIIRILVGRRFATMPRLANEFRVSRMTIIRDILALTAKYPIETVQGNGGGVKLADWYRPCRNQFSQEQQRVLTSAIEKADDPYEAEILQQILEAYGSKRPSAVPSK